MGSLVCREITNPSDMAALVPGWQALTNRVLEANPFYEPSFLQPLIDETGPYRGLQFWVVAPRDAPGDLRGVFPFHRRRVGPVILLSPFTRGRSGGQHIDIDLGVPLVDAACADAVIDAVLDRVDCSWLIGLDWFALTEDGLFHRVLMDRLAARNQPSLDLGGWARPFFKPRADVETYFSAALSKRRSSQVARFRRRLEREGAVAFEVLHLHDDVQPWIETYFRLEASGWKGRQRSDVGATVQMRNFFAAAMRRRHAQNGLFAYRLVVGEKVVAQTWVLRPADGNVGLAWKMAYDEAYAKDSPGLQMQIAAIEFMHGPSPPLHMFDSCAHSQHSMLHWLLLDERSLVCRLVVANSRAHRAALRLADRIRQWRAARPRPASPVDTSETDE